MKTSCEWCGYGYTCRCLPGRRSDDAVMDMDEAEFARYVEESKGQDDYEDFVDDE